MEKQTDPDNPLESTEQQPRDVTYWAQRFDKMRVTEIPAEALNANVEGRLALGPLQGFGPLWEKTYRVRFETVEVTPAEVITAWKANFASFWPPDSRFYIPAGGITPGQVAVINISGPAGARLSTGIMVMYADEESFAFMTPEGHMFSGWITFSAYLKGGVTVAQSQVLIRSDDPVWEFVNRLYGFRKEDQMWRHVLTSLAAHFGVLAEVQMEKVCIDPRIQWSRAKNIWYNAGMRTMVYTVGALARGIRLRHRG